ncbi:sigma-E processing peptidase SpoIIGA [Lutispora sp.]|uniref:sigma-E processing peptidase SpoIIGA n=1 Tax=Lutispora sp. TaxID=2828727 RepID=UPI000EC9CB4E|nr:sigma-E processing peptidase SpoIIGA [Lutispora sp.]MEA4961998.1 sigma-E processing peptidase SpoIIGA [Lutispora sp.]HCJ57523.1 sigma-E processing peptidase SpoIIGA [Clostridiaceae bacterium]
MIQYVYGDVIFVENLVMNCIILFSTAKLTRSRYKKLNIFLASIIGSVYSVFYYFPGYEYLYTWFLKLIFSLFIIALAFTPYNLKEFGRAIAVFYIVSLIFGGAAFGVFYFINGIKFSYQGIFYMESFPVKLLFASILSAYIIIKISWGYIVSKIRREKILMDVSVLQENKKIYLVALVDTGNSLTDPITNLPVLIAEYEIVKELLPEEIQRIFEENKDNNLNVIASVLSKSEWMTKFRFIPFKSLGNENGMLIGFKPDAINVEDKNTKKNIKDIIIAIYNKKLSKDGEYNALLHPDILSYYNGGKNSA